MNDIKKIIIVHVNSYTAQINDKDIASFNETDNSFEISLKSNYEYEPFGLPRWSSIEPFDKDEITSIQLKFASGVTRDITVPFKDVSPNGAYCSNGKSEINETDDIITIKWCK